MTAAHRDPRGHQSLPHTADVILEAWGPDLATCCEEAVAALVDLYVQPLVADTVETRHLHLLPTSAESLLLAVLDEVIFTLDTAEAVPVGATVTAAGSDGFDLRLLLADRAAVESTGVVPKAISRSELSVDERPDEVRCSFLVDV